MAKRPLSVQLRPSSALHSAAGGHDGGSVWSTRRLSMGDVITDEQRSSSELTVISGQTSSGSTVGRRPVDLSVNGSCLPRRRDRCSPSSCKRPIVLTLPRLDLSLIQESSLWKDESSVGQGDCQGQTARSRDTGVGCRCTTPSVPVLTSSSSSRLSSSFSCECLGAGLTSLTPACLSATSASESASLFNAEPTNILPFLFLGSQRDALSSDIISKNGIEYVVNVSATCPQSPFVAESKFLRIPVNDGQHDRLLPFFTDVFHFLDAVRESSGRVLVHCLAGISRSPTVVIAYVMHHLRLSIDDAYRYVKTRRPTISPNFNFLGQLVEFDTQLTKQRSDDTASSASESAAGVTQMTPEVPERVPSPNKRPCMINLSHAAESRRSLSQNVDGVTAVQSPTVALSRLQFVEQRQTSSTAAVNVPPKSTTTNGLVVQDPPAFQSRPRTADPSAGVAQVDHQLTSSSSSSSSSTGRDVLTSHSKASRSGSLSQGTQQQDQQKLPSSSSWSNQSTSTTCGGDMIAVSVDKTAVNSANVTADMLLVDWQTSFKSRSLEDILLVSSTPPRSLGHGQGHVTSHWTPAGEGADESSPLSGHASLTASHGSLSTGHASLHGSREMIQVS